MYQSLNWDFEDISKEIDISDSYKLLEYLEDVSRYEEWNDDEYDFNENEEIDINTEIRLNINWFSFTDYPDINIPVIRSQIHRQ